MLKKIIQNSIDGIVFIKEKSWREIWQNFNSKDAIPTFQFAKYGICGLSAVLTQLIVVIILSYTIIPAMGEKGNLLADSQRAKNLFINNLIAFPISNFVAYYTNALWVFTSGRHSKLKEFLYFTIVAFISFIAGAIAGPKMIDIFGIGSGVAQGLTVFTSAVVNFICRKFFIFSK